MQCLDNITLATIYLPLQYHTVVVRLTNLTSPQDKVFYHTALKQYFRLLYISLLSLDPRLQQLLCSLDLSYHEHLIILDLVNDRPAQSNNITEELLSLYGVYPDINYQDNSLIYCTNRCNYHFRKGNI